MATLESCASSPGSWKALTSPSKSDRWVCIPEPCTPARGLGMKLAWTPRSMAISFTTSLKVMTLSAMVRASV